MTNDPVRSYVVRAYRTAFDDRNKIADELATVQKRLDFAELVLDLRQDDLDNLPPVKNLK